MQTPPTQRRADEHRERGEYEDEVIAEPATDTHGNSASASFTVRVKGAGEQLADLLAAVTGVGPGTSLADKGTLAQTYVTANDVPDACSTLTAFVREVMAQSNKTIPTGQAATLIATAQRIKMVLGC